jgi:hypothetical protein
MQAQMRSYTHSHLHYQKFYNTKLEKEFSYEKEKKCF